MASVQDVSTLIGISACTLAMRSCTYCHCEMIENSAKVRSIFRTGYSSSWYCIASNTHGEPVPLNALGGRNNFRSYKFLTKVTWKQIQCVNGVDCNFADEGFVNANMCSSQHSTVAGGLFEVRLHSSALCLCAICFEF